MTFLWFGDARKAKTMMLVMGAITTALLVIAGVLAGLQLVRQATWDHVTAVVTAYDTTDGEGTWTEFEYSLDGGSYTYRENGHSYWMSPGSEVELLVDPSDPHRAQVIYDNPYIVSVIVLAAGGLFAVFFLLYLANYATLRNRDKRAAS